MSFNDSNPVRETGFGERLFLRTQLKPGYGCEQLHQLISDYVTLLLGNLSFVLQRYDPIDGSGFIDTKFDLHEGSDFNEAHSIKSKNVVYGWVQGRALEALAEHYYWAMDFQEEIGENSIILREEIVNVLKGLSDRLEAMRNRHGGRLSFLMKEDGTALAVGSNNQLIERELPEPMTFGYTDIFYAKGLFSAAKVTGDKGKALDATLLFDSVVEAIREERFVSDQLVLDADNRSLKRTREKRTYANRMIAIGGLEIFLRHTGDLKYAEAGIEFIRHAIDNYVNLDGRISNIPQFVMWEYTTLLGEPFIEDGQLCCLPGHVLEFVGLSLKFIHCCEGTLGDCFQSELDGFRAVLPKILLANFKGGWNPSGMGIYQSIDLLSGLSFYSQMPWWNLPETIRAAVGCAKIVPDEERRGFLEIARLCSNAFLMHYVQAPPYLLSIQALDADGDPDRSIPAVPDLDPCYHTGLSLIDAMRYFSLSLTDPESTTHRRQS
ncbi:hypothetical protein [Rubellicoccus peritrichatus]|uniref:Uncharacterized protein n=1 Tax=Rubellicoccus peritrichatus TaxID=3080537 RepID=A0AAQ3L9F7_9BACT|nr:hypothetical protein [Puniceicoccus sp. CR14]WOO41541.1 hypothetical protein RZN69_00470 [Puniceicoccus sp. CR14]